jgi:hypothetical protein
MKMPFLYMLTDPSGEPTGSYMVKVASHTDFTTYDCGWMGDPRMGDTCLVPDVDLCESSIMFDGPDALQNELDAMAYMKKCWAEVVVPTAEEVRSGLPGSLGED